MKYGNDVALLRCLWRTYQIIFFRFSFSLMEKETQFVAFRTCLMTDANAQNLLMEMTC